MEITEKEYFYLEEQVQRLRNRVSELEQKQKITFLFDSVQEKPITGVTSRQNSEPYFIYSSFSASFSSEWKAFLTIAKQVHAGNFSFYMSTAYPESRQPYIRTCNSEKKYRAVNDLSEDQKQTSLNMLNEMIPIYNKYYKMIHPKVLYSASGRVEPEWIDIVDSVESNKEEHDRETDAESIEKKVMLG